MATNWPPITHPTWPPPEASSAWLSASNLKTLERLLASLGFTKDTPTAIENTIYFKQVKCDEGHSCLGLMFVSPAGVRYPFAYCTRASHKSALVLWVVGIDNKGIPFYDLGGNTGVLE